MKYTLAWWRCVNPNNTLWYSVRRCVTINITRTPLHPVTTWNGTPCMDTYGLNWPWSQLQCVNVPPCCMPSCMFGPHLGELWHCPPPTAGMFRLADVGRMSSTLVETVSLNYEDFNDSFLTCGTCLCVYDGQVGWIILQKIVWEIWVCPHQPFLIKKKDGRHSRITNISSNGNQPPNLPPPPALHTRTLSHKFWICMFHHPKNRLSFKASPCFEIMSGSTMQQLAIRNDIIISGCHICEIPNDTQR